MPDAREAEGRPDDPTMTHRAGVAHDASMRFVANRPVALATLVAVALGGLVSVPGAALATDSTANPDGSLPGPHLTVNVAKDRHDISALIYGVNFADASSGSRRSA